MNYYNDNDPFAAQWLRNLIEAGLIPKGYVDERSIAEVDPESLRAFRQCHFFAGIGGWPLALQLAGWPEDRPVWTGSCPCQPFSVAGKGDGTADERHLWPAFRSLIAEYRPATVFGEQVASKDGRIWLAGVRSDLEDMGYVVGAADLCAAGVSAPHIRQRLYWVAQSSKQRSGDHIREACGPRWESMDSGATGLRQGHGAALSVRLDSGGTGGDGVADAEHAKRRQGNTTRYQHDRYNAGREEAASGPTACCSVDNRLGHAAADGRRQERPDARGRTEGSEPQERVQRPWDNSGLIPCADGKQRRVPAKRVDNPEGLRRSERPDVSGGEDAGILTARAGQPVGDGCLYVVGAEPIFEIESALFHLADGLPGRVGLLKGAGNAIVPQVAAEFIAAFMETGHLERN